jgi:hypothetical protein
MRYMANGFDFEAAEGQFEPDIQAVGQIQLAEYDVLQQMFIEAWRTDMSYVLEPDGIYAIRIVREQLLRQGYKSSVISRHAQTACDIVRLELGI